MATKALNADQHLPLHERWPDNCCLCAAESRIQELVRKVDELTAQLKARDEPQRRKLKINWTCPICSKTFTYPDPCEHWYFDSQVALGPLPRNKDGGDDGKRKTET
jgi:hypothetical protein